MSTGNVQNYGRGVHTVLFRDFAKIQMTLPSPDSTEQPELGKLSESGTFEISQSINELMVWAIKKSTIRATREAVSVLELADMRPKMSDSKAILEVR